MRLGVELKNDQGEVIAIVPVQGIKDDWTYRMEIRAGLNLQPGWYAFGDYVQMPDRPGRRALHRQHGFPL